MLELQGQNSPESLESIISDIREFSNTPIYVGFGVNEKSAKEKSKGVDGVIVGSAFIKILLDESLTYSKKIVKISQIAKNIKYSINE